ncbi:MAG: MerR family transcriptional regulator [Proteobacteria bacterium]|nr:MerR family transcriptional regulator [Pseudomonadota bacterium]
MKISELVSRTNVARETIHYYIREGVLAKPRKKGKNTADYDEGYIDQIRIIKGLQDNYYLPLSVIKKILKSQKKKSVLDQSTLWIHSEYSRPIDQLLSEVVEGREKFIELTGLDGRWVDQMESWGVLASQVRNGVKIYSRDDVVIGKLISDMGTSGFGSKEGYDPEELRRFVDFFRSVAKDWMIRYIEPSLEMATSEDFTAKGGQFTEMMSLFFYHAFRRIVREEFAKFLKNIAKD